MNRVLTLAALLTTLGTWPALAEDLPWKVNPPIATVSKQLYFRHPRPGAAALASEAYVGPGLERLEYRGLETVDDAPENSRFRFSRDNGRTWVDFEPAADPSPEARGIGGGPTVFDPAVGALVRVGLRQLASKGQVHNFVYAQFSRDFGRTWTRPRQLRYEPGEDFDPASPLKPGFLRFNQAYRGSNILRCRGGALVHCVGLANAPSDPENDRRPYRLGGLCFIGTWDPQAGDYRWKAGGRVSISPRRSPRGLMEPDVAELRDGRLLVVWRGSGGAEAGGHKWYSMSQDQGLTLTEPAEWTYDDGSRFYSPSSWHLTLRHSITGKLYWFGNISAEPPDDNWPRFPLVLAEVDEQTGRLKRSTVTAIDDRHPGQSDRIQFSNFSLLEDRETRRIEMLLTVYSEDPSDWRNADGYKYTLTLRVP
jgi:hypothetical protein